MIEKYALYDDESESIVELADTEEEIRDSYRTAKIFRKMVNKKPLQMAKVHLTEEEYAEFNKNNK